MYVPPLIFLAPYWSLQKTVSDRPVRLIYLIATTGSPMTEWTTVRSSFHDTFQTSGLSTTSSSAPARATSFRADSRAQLRAMNLGVEIYIV